jgi:transcription-repair coupling factor (superfamily II helicase)
MLSEIAHKRLQALLENHSFGGGMKIAMRDLEIRGAGDLLGTKQSGHVASIGFHLYCKLLKKTIEALQGKGTPHLVESKIEHSFEARLPESYVHEKELRLEFYHRLGSASTLAEVDSLLKELEDRFGRAPEPLIWLYVLTRLKIKASEKGYVLIKVQRASIVLEKKEKSSLRTVLFSVPRDPRVFEEMVSALL